MLMQMGEHSASRVNILGIGITPVHMDGTLQTISHYIEENMRAYICVTSVNGVMESQKDSELRTIHNNAGMVTPDGMPLVWLSHLFGYNHVERVYGPDLMLAVCENSTKKGYRHFLYGGKQGVPELLAKQLKILFPDICIVGTYSPPFRPLTEGEDKEIIQKINHANADIVWVGLSTPKQEKWMAAHINKLNAPVLIGVGAAFDFHAGIKKQAPRWMQRSGLEWLFRLLNEPRRLWRRYLIYNPQFLWLIILQWLGLKEYNLPNSTETILNTIRKKQRTTKK